MKMNINFLLAISAVFLIFSCSEDDNEEDSFDFKEIALDKELIRIPEGLKNSTDLNAITCYSYLQTATNLSNWIGFIEPPGNAQQISSGDVYEYQWPVTIGGNQLLYMWNFQESGNEYNWDINIQVDDQTFTFLDAVQSKDGSTGSVSYNFNYTCPIYNENNADCEPATWNYQWETDQDDIVTFNYNVDDPEEVGTSLGFSYEIVSYPDSSGVLEQFDNEELTYKAEWDQEGNGEYTHFSNGEVISTGEWDV